MSETPAPSPLRLVLVSFVALFHEMLFIRWLSGECRVYGYYANLPLICAFFGLGLGCLLANRTRRLMPAFLPLTLLFAVLATSPFYRKFGYVGWTTEQLWAREHLAGALGTVTWYVSFLFLLLLGTTCFVPLGQELGRAFNAFKRPLQAYALNLGGSLAGVWGFALVCWLIPSSLPWFVISIAIALLLDRGRSRLVGAVCALGLLTVVWFSDRNERWSPYYKIVKTDTMAENTSGVMEKVGTDLNVNNDYYQRMLDLRPATVERFPGLLGASIYYNNPYRFCRPRTVLIVGAGSGNDVAAALRAGAEQVDAVDIDPEIVRYGRQLHPEKPYDSPRVRVIVADARSFFKRSAGRYDLIVFGLLDSHTLVSGFGRLRLDNYVYTEESIREARACLAPGGAVYVGFTIYTEWVHERFCGIFARVFGTSFIVGARPYDAAGIFVGSDRIADWKNASPGEWNSPTGLEQINVEISTDDWPFLYMESRTIPSEYVIMLSILLALFFTAGKLSLRSGAAWDWQMVLLGAGFLLVQVRGMAALALLFGATWIVIAIVISIILLMALAANALAERWPKPNIPVMFLGLGAALLLSWAIPSSALLSLSAVARGALGGFLVALPMAFSGVIFSTALRNHRDPETALGCNLIGAVFGGFSEYVSTVTGIKALALVALGYYLVAYLVWKRRKA